MSSRTTRPRKPPSRKKLISPASLSLTSLFSSITQVSAGSSGSNSTVTQESVSRGKHKPTRHGGSRKPVAQSPRRGTTRHSRPMTPVEEQRPNVFAFMEEGEEDDESVSHHTPAESDEESGHEIGGSRNMDPPSPPTSPEDAAPRKLPTMLEQSHETWNDHPATAGSFYSDSGISVRSNSLERQSSAASRKAHNRSFVARPPQMSRDASNSSAASHSSSSRPVYRYDDPPETFYGRAARTVFGNSDNTRKSKEAPAKTTLTSKQLTRPTKPETSHSSSPKSGYDFLASMLSTTSDDGPSPVYRRFETLNNRILLVLQDEITTMENDLAYLDRTILQTESPRGRPSSRRAELAAPTPLQWQRMHICGMLISKLTQYNRAVASYSALAQLPSASEEDVEMYRDLLAKYKPVVSSETDFLDHVSDLAAIPRQTSNTSSSERPALATGCIVLMTIVAFKLVPSILGRMGLGAVVVVAMTWADLLPRELGDSENGWTKKVAVYAGAIFMLALAVG